MCLHVPCLILSLHHFHFPMLSRPFNSPLQRLNSWTIFYFLAFSEPVSPKPQHFKIIAILSFCLSNSLPVSRLQGTLTSLCDAASHRSLALSPCNYFTVRIGVRCCTFPISCFIVQKNLCLCALNKWNDRQCLLHTGRSTIRHQLVLVCAFKKNLAKETTV